MRKKYTQQAAGKWTLRLHCWCRASSATLSKEKRAGFSDPLWSSAAVWPAPAATEGSLFVTSSDLPVSRTSSEQGEKGAKRRRAHSQHKHAVWRGTTLRNVIDRSASNVPVFGNICVERRKKKWEKSETRPKSGPHRKQADLLDNDWERRQYVVWERADIILLRKDVFLSKRQRSLRLSMNSTLFHF